MGQDDDDAPFAWPEISRETWKCISIAILAYDGCNVLKIIENLTFAKSRSKSDGWERALCTGVNICATVDFSKLQSARSEAMSRPSSDHSQRTTKQGQIGFYQFERSLGEGNFAKVKLATHTITKEKVLFH